MSFEVPVTYQQFRLVFWPGHVGPSKQLSNGAVVLSKGASVPQRNPVTSLVEDLCNAIQVTDRTSLCLWNGGFQKLASMFSLRATGYHLGSPSGYRVLEAPSELSVET